MPVTPAASWFERRIGDTVFHADRDHRRPPVTGRDQLGLPGQATRPDGGEGAARCPAAPQELPPFWPELAGLGWLGLHVPEQYGGSGYGLEELAVVTEQLGRMLAPGPFAPTVIASAVLVAAAADETKKELLPGLADGSVIGGIAFEASVTVTDGSASGTLPVALGGGLAQVLLMPSDDDVLVVKTGTGVLAAVPPNLDPTRPCARVSLDRAQVTVLPGAARLLTDLARVVLSAEAAGLARECTELAAAYAKQREQFGQPIATFQAVKHPLRQHGGGGRTGDLGRVGRRQGRADRRRPADLRRGGGGGTGGAGRGPAPT